MVFPANSIKSKYENISALSTILHYKYPIKPQTHLTKQKTKLIIFEKFLVKDIERSLQLCRQLILLVKSYTAKVHIYSILACLYSILVFSLNMCFYLVQLLARNLCICPAVFHVLLMCLQNMMINIQLYLVVMWQPRKNKMKTYIMYVRHSNHTGFNRKVLSKIFYLSLIVCFSLCLRLSKFHFL